MILVSYIRACGGRYIYHRKMKAEKKAKYPAYGWKRERFGRKEFLSMFCAFIAALKRIQVNDMTVQFLYRENGVIVGHSLKPRLTTKVRGNSQHGGRRTEAARVIELAGDVPVM